MKKRLLASLLSLAMVLTLLPVTALAAGEDDTPQEPTSTTEDAIAEITVGQQTTQYFDEDAFEAAAEALTGDATIKLLQNVEITGTKTADKFVFAGSNIVLNLDGHTLSVEYRIDVKGKLTIQGTGTIKSAAKYTSTAYAVFYVYNDGELVLSNGTVNAAKDGAGYALYTQTAANASVSGGVLNGQIDANAGTLSITGGQFTADISPYLGASKSAATGTDGYYSISSDTLTANDAAARIGDSEYYATVAGALAAAEENETVTVLNDTTETTGITCSGENVTLDLNGKTVDMGSKKITVSGGLTIKDSGSQFNGTITGTAGQMLTVSSSLTLASGKIVTTGYGAVRTNSGATFTMTGGTVQGNPAVQGYKGTVKITGGSVLANESDSLAIENDSAQITIGTADATSHETPYIEGVDVGENTSVNLYSGTVTSVEGILSADAAMTCRFTSDITDALPAGKACIEENGYWKVVALEEANAAAKIGDTLYASVSVAMSAMKSGDTLTLLKDYESSASKAIEITVENATLDLNGCNITSNDGYGVYVKTEAATTFTLKNSGSEASSITSTGDAALYASTNSSQKIVTINVQGNIELKASTAEAIELGYAKLAYSEDVASLVGNGGFKATESGGEYIYGTAAAAIKASTDNTATLLNDYTGDDGLALATENAIGIIDLNGHTFTTSAPDAIAANAKGVTLTVKNGTVISTSKGSAENWPAGAAINYGSGYYDNASITLDKVQLTVKNPGYGVVVSGNNTDNSITLKNSTITVPSTGVGIYFPPKSGTLTIKNSNVTGGTAVIVKGGTASISGDSVIHATGAKVVPTAPKGSGANDTGDAVYLEGNYERKTTINITGGTFTSDNGYAVQMLFANNTANKTISITGGSFSSDPSAYVTEEYIALVENGQYVVKDKGEIEVAVVPAAPSVPAPDTEGMSDDEKKMAGNVQTALTSTTNPISADGLDAVANTVAADTEEKPAEYVDELKKLEGVSDEITEDKVTIVVQPYLNVVIDDVTIKDDTKAITLDITPMYRTIATAANLGDSNAEIKVRGDEGVDDSAANAVVINDGGKLNAIGQVEISIPLPDGFVSNTTDKVYVQHKGYEYNTAVTKSDSGESETYAATFTNPHGFSTFTISTESQTVAMLNGVSYTSLQDALADAEDGDTVKVLRNGLTASMSGNTRTITLANGVAGAEITVTINGETKNIATGGTVEFTFTRPSSSGGGSSTPTYTVSKPSDVTGGEISVSPSRAAKNATVTITVKPDEGYELDELIVRDSDGETVELTQKSDTEYTFKMPASKVTVEVSFVEIEPTPSELPFTDVAADAWYHDAVAYVYDNGMMNGVTENMFAPNATTTRGMIVTMLHRLEGEPGVNYLLPFTDVAEGLWYTEAVRWAASEGIVNGVSDTSYAPDNAITREQMAAILYRYAQYKGYNTSVGGMSLAEYTDADQISSYATTAMQWANENGLITGRTDTTLAPQSTATRAEVATILMRFCEDVVK